MVLKPIAYVGIDPGKTGACALISDNVIDYFDYEDVSTVANEFQKWTYDYDIKLAILEKVSAMPKQGVVSMFNFGVNFGSYQGILSALSIPYRLFTPAKWQKYVMTKTDGETTKERSLKVARRLFPSAELHLRKHNGRADAILMAYVAQNYLT